MSVIELHESVDGKTKFVVRNVLPHQTPILAATNSKNHIPLPPPHTHTRARARAHIRAHIQGEHSKLALGGETVENTKTASAKKAELQAHIQTQNHPTKT